MIDLQFKNIAEENLIQSNNDFDLSDNFIKNRLTNDNYFSSLELYLTNIDWDYQYTNHEDLVSYFLDNKHNNDFDSEMYINVPTNIKEIIDQLNKLDKNIFFDVDVIILFEGYYYQFIYGKEYLFKYKSSSLKLKDTLIIPIFVPIRSLLFYGDEGSFKSLINYGKILSNFKSDNKYIDVIRNELEVDLLERIIYEICRAD